MSAGVARDGGEKRRRKMTMSDALKWAWGDELPKASLPGLHAPSLGTASAWGSILHYGQLGSIVDRQPNHYGCIPFDEAGWPHADALRIADAVADLAHCSVDVPEGWHPMPELGAIDEALAARAVADALIKATVADPSGGLRFRARPDVLVVRHAILGLVPEWRLWEKPVKEFETWPNGRHRWYVRRDVRTVIGEMADGSDRVEVMTTEVEGWSSRLQRPVAGAFRKARFRPDPVPAMVARGEYEIFCAAMCMLFDQLADQLETIDLIAVDWPVQPWGDSTEREGASPEPRILPDLSSASRLAVGQKSETISKARPSRKGRRKSP